MEVLCMKILNGQQLNDYGTKERGRLQCRIGLIGIAPNGTILTEGSPNPWPRAEIRLKRLLTLTQGIIVCTGKKKVKIEFEC